MSELLEFRKPGSTPVEWNPPTALDIPVGSMIAFDQSIRNTGWVHLISDGAGAVKLKSLGTLRTKPKEQKGWESTLADANELYGLLRVLFWNLFPTEEHGIAFESPAAYGLRTESSALSAFAIKILAHEEGVVPSMIGAQTMKKFMTGNGNAKKPQVKLSIENNFKWIENLHWLRNEHERDALGIGLTAMASWS